MCEQIQCTVSKMKCWFLFLFLCSIFAPFECQDSDGELLNSFLVTRHDTKESVCILPSSYTYYAFPTFDLDQLQIPRDVGIKYWDWLGDWKLQNDSNVRHTQSENKMLIAGNQPLLFVGRVINVVTERSPICILASNITLWVEEKNRPRGAGMLFELDHLNEKTKLKETTMKICDKHPEDEGANCTIVDYKNATNHLNNGNSWTRFEMDFKENQTGVEMIENIYGEEKSVVQWAWINAKVPYPFTFENFDIFAKSHQRNAALWTTANFPPDLANNRVMKRKYATRNSGKLCVKVWWNNGYSTASQELLIVKNLVSGRVEPATNTTHTVYYMFFEWNHLDAGEYEITLRFDKRKPEKIELCQDQDSNIKKRWTSIPKAVKKCQFRVGKTNEISAWPSSTPEPKLKPNWTLGDWEHVCDQLGIASKDTEVPITFCNTRGCNFSKCPYLQDEPSYIFDF